MPCDVCDISIVMVTRTNRRYLEPCLESLYADPPRYTFEVVIVDNGSDDDTPAFVRARYPGIQVIENGCNAGLSRASNQGIAATSGRHVLLLNDDTLLNGRSLDALVAFMDAHPDAGAVGGRLLNDDGTEQSCYNDFSSLTEELLIATRLGPWLSASYPSRIGVTKARAVDWIGSACLLLRRQALIAVGVLDEDYFIYGDEADLQFRLRAAGWRVYFTPESSIIHFGGRSLDRWRRRRMVYRGKLLFYRKNYGRARTAGLRLLLGTLSTAKLAWWGLAALVPPQRLRAQREIRSNIEVVALCTRLE